MLCWPRCPGSEGRWGVSESSDVNRPDLQDGVGLTRAVEAAVDIAVELCLELAADSLQLTG